MDKRKFLIFVSALMAATAIAWGAGPAYAGPGTLATPPAPDYPASVTPSGGTFFANSPLGVWRYTQNPAMGTYTSATSNSGTALRKFVDSLPGLGLPGCNPATTCNANNLGQYIPIAQADTTTFSGSDYYEIGLKDYTKKMHSDLPKATRLRGYYQKNGTDHSSQYLGPVILASRNRPVRIKFTNELATDASGNLFIPTDTTYMGAGMSPDGTLYTQNRATLHLHGGFTPWISDGTPHQWTVPKGQPFVHKKGLSVAYVPDMWFDANGAVIAACAGKTACSTPGARTNPGDGALTFFYTNQQSNRLMFYHDHAYGITRLNVYVGEAAGYLLTDASEDAMINAGTIPNICAGANSTVCEYRYGIPLVIQDKSFVPQDIAVQDASWNTTTWGQYGDLWFPHIYETNQWPTNPDMSGANNFGRWDYGPWFWPVFPVTIPGLPTMAVSGVPESFMDTMVVNGTAYPYLPVEPKAYRFRILNAGNDRMLNLQFYVGDPSGNLTGGFPTEVKMVDAIPRVACGGLVAQPNCTCTATITTNCFPDTWPTDGRTGGVPDPTLAGPQMIQIGSEGGFLPAPTVIPNQPVNYEYNRRNIVVLNVTDKALFMGPAERADVLIDFSAFAGKTIILYNDAPAPVPAFDPRFDYYTGNPDNTFQGGAPSTVAGFGPNTRTIMQFRVGTSVTKATSANLATLQTALPAYYLAQQDPPVVPQTAYPAPWKAATDTYSHIADVSLNFTPVGSTKPTIMGMKPKAIQELFTSDYGRMNATLGTELPFTTAFIQTTLPFGYIDPATEVMIGGKPQIWKITHNGVDTHAIHFHLFNVQVINRVGWDGAIRPPDPNELGWKETVRMHPLEDIIVAMKPVLPVLPFTLPNSVRPLDVTLPLGTTAQFTGIDPLTGNPITVTNDWTDFGHEYVWHCHLLGHEENDMMRPIVFYPGIQWKIVGTGDFNGDNAPDILWRNTGTGENMVWYMDMVTHVGTAKLETVPLLDWEIVGTGDFNRDGRVNILWRSSTTGENAVWYMNGVTHTGSAALETVSLLNWKIVGTGDFNRDGNVDILWRSSTTGENAVWYMNGVRHTGSANLETVGLLNWNIVGTGDFNDDGRVDILWRSSTTGENAVWYMNGVTHTGSANLETVGLLNWNPVGVGDFANDGRTDILWRAQDTGEDAVWYMIGVRHVGSVNLETFPIF